jgi:hypothetical protein
VIRTAALSVLVLASVAGCIRSETYRPHAFVPEPRHYRVRYLRGEEDAARMLPEGWLARGYHLDEEGRPTSRLDDARVGIDSDGDGTRDTNVPRFDMRYAHEEDGAEIWSSTIPLPPREARRSTRALVHRLIDAAYASELVRWDPADRPTVVDERPVIVGGAEGHRVTFEIRAPRRSRTFTLVALRPGQLGWVEGGLARPDGRPMLVVIGYAARPRRHALHLPELEALLDRIDVRPDAL